MVTEPRLASTASGPCFHHHQLWPHVPQPSVIRFPVTQIIENNGIIWYPVCLQESMHTRLNHNGIHANSWPSFASFHINFAENIAQHGCGCASGASAASSPGTDARRRPPPRPAVAQKGHPTSNLYHPSTDWWAIFLITHMI